MYSWGFEKGDDLNSDLISFICMPACGRLLVDFVAIQVMYHQPGFCVASCRQCQCCFWASLACFCTLQALNETKVRFAALEAKPMELSLKLRVLQDYARGPTDGKFLSGSMRLF